MRRRRVIPAQASAQKPQAAPMPILFDEAAAQMSEAAQLRARDYTSPKGPFDELFKAVWADMDIELIPD